VPYIEAKNSTAQFEHEATTSKISEDQKFYVMQRGIPEEEAIALIVNGFVKEVAGTADGVCRAQKLISISRWKDSPSKETCLDPREKLIGISGLSRGS
jgi:Fe-S cluster assembly protein SufB